jgi:hypothetical protein
MRAKHHDPTYLKLLSNIEISLFLAGGELSADNKSRVKLKHKQNEIKYSSVLIVMCTRERKSRNKAVLTQGKYEQKNERFSAAIA